MRRTRLFRGSLALCAWIVGTALLAPVAQGHPYLSEDAETIGQGRWQLELNTDHTRTRAAGQREREQELGLELSHGLSDALDLSLASHWVRSHEPGASAQAGVGDLELLLDWRWLDHGQGWQLALQPVLSLPTGNAHRGRGTGKATLQMKLISSLEWGAWTWLANAGIRLHRNTSGERRHLWTLSSALLHEPAPGWTMGLDLQTGRAADRGQNHESAVVIGLAYQWTPTLELDAGWQRSLGAGPRAQTFGLGLSRQW